MNSEYLYIYKSEEYTKVSSCDGVFDSIATVKDFTKYCEEKADRWLNSDLGNFDGWKKKDREEKAYRWLKAKDLPEGEYEFYFNLGDIKENFRKAVAQLAKNMRITNYILKV